MKDQFFKNALAKTGYVEFWTENFNINQIDKGLENLPDKQMAEVIDYVIDALDQDLSKFSTSERKMNEMRAKLAINLKNLFANKQTLKKF